VSQGRRIGYQPPPSDDTPCNLDELACRRHIAESRYGANLTVSYAWKHFMYEDYERGMFNSWEGGGGPHYLFLSSGAHDCFHEPKVRPSQPALCCRLWQGRDADALLHVALQDLQHHIMQLVKLARHLSQLENQTVIWVDANPMTHGAHEADTMDCVRDINDAALQQAHKLGLYMFSRQSMILSGKQVDEKGDYPMHQPDKVVREQVDLLTAWLSCMLQEPET
jgi:hypothetical protein